MARYSVLTTWAFGPGAGALAPIARPVFAWNHDHVMRNGGAGLSRLLGVPLLLSD